MSAKWLMIFLHTYVVELNRKLFLVKRKNNTIITENPSENFFCSRTSYYGNRIY